MPVLQIQDLTKSFGARTLFSGVSFQLDEGDKVGLVGANGTGKSTLLRCIAGLEDYDGGNISFAKGVRVSYLSQSMELDTLEQPLSDFMLAEYQDLIELRKHLKILERQMAREEVYNDEQRLREVMKEYSTSTEKYENEGGYSFETRIKEVLFGLGFGGDDLDRPMSTFSGGQKTRLHLARILLRQPELLLLDEPTNYLDLQAVEWLEGFLKAYKGTLLVVSHDRYFLDEFASRILELEELTIFSYPGNYSAFVLQKALKQAAQSKEYAKEQEKIRRLEEYIRRNKAGVNARQAKGREKQLSKLGGVVRPSQREYLSFSFQQAHASGEEVLKVKNLALAYPGKVLAEKLDFKLQRGERAGLIGPNGCGKTTFLKAILGDVPYQGTVVLGAGVKVGYFAQEHETLGQGGTILDEVMGDRQMTVQAARDLLARFQFKGDDVYKATSSLSGGEESRLLLAKLFLSGANLLILDEPTNHLDLYARQGLEDALADFPGTLLFVSHDRYFLNRLVDKIVEFDQGKLTEYLGDYDYYRAKKAAQVTEQLQFKASAEKERSKPKKTAKPEQRIKKLEKEILEAEELLEKLAESLGDTGIYSQPGKVIELQQEYKAVEEGLSSLYQAWEEAVEAFQEGEDAGAGQRR